MKIDKQLVAMICGVTFTLWALVGLVLIAVYGEVLILEPNRWILGLEIAAVSYLLYLSVWGLMDDG